MEKEELLNRLLEMENVYARAAIRASRGGEFCAAPLKKVDIDLSKLTDIRNMICDEDDVTELYESRKDAAESLGGIRFRFLEVVEDSFANLHYPLSDIILHVETIKNAEEYICSLFDNQLK